MNPAKLMKQPSEGKSSLRAALSSAAILLLFSLMVPLLGHPEGLPGPEDIQGLYQSGLDHELMKALDGKDGSREPLQLLYLGLSALRVGETEKAIRAWKDYVDLGAGSESARKVSRYLSQLIQSAAAKQARAALAQERSLSTHFDAKAIAVSPFQNLGAEQYAPLSKGLAAMIITDLSQVKALKVVERIRIQAVLNELKLAKSGLLAPKSAPRLGKLVGAGRVTTGSLLDLSQEAMRLDAAIIRTESAQLLASPKAEGRLVAFYKVEKALVFKILCGIGHCPESLDSRTRLAVEKVHTKNFKAFQLYSEGLDFFDQGRYREAARAFFLALEEDPQFALARNALLDTPVVQLEMGAIIAGGEAIAEGEAPVIDFKALSAPQALAKLVPPKTEAAPQNEEKPFSKGSAPALPRIFQQALGNGKGIGGGPAKSVPVEIELQLP